MEELDMKGNIKSGIPKKGQIKRSLCAIMIVTMCLALFGCGDKADAGVDMEDFMGYSLSNIEFEDEITRIQDNMVSMLYDLPEGTEAQVCVGSGATAEELAIFKASSADNVKALKDSINSHIEDRISSFADYMPAEVQKLEQAIIHQRGNYIVVVVTDDENAEEKVKEYFR
ncbi:MAG TPA: DUF4358 domain-containing protein [Anaerovoracaceae bacterium]|nr:DUF4358 domain-containing protein [Anaerovoracaceae bacterium]